MNDREAAYQFMVENFDESWLTPTPRFGKNRTSNKPVTSSKGSTADREAYQIIKLFKQGDLSRQEAESQLLALGFGEDLIKKRLDDVSLV